MVRIAVALLAVAVALPAVAFSAAAEPMNAQAARHFVAGKHFSFTCFEGSVGSGRIFHDGSVAGVVRMGGNGATRFMHLPPGTLYAKGDAICSNVKGAFFNPCFNLDKTSDRSFRGAISGFGFAYCDFTRRGRGETVTASVAPDAGAAPRASIRRGRRPAAAKPAESKPAEAKPAEAKPAEAKTAASRPVAAPSQPVTAAPLPPVEQAGMRSSIAP
jgi:hypothetical protein